MAAALLERETLDKAEIDLIIEGKELPPFKSPLAYADPGPGDGQKVVKPEPGPGRKPGFSEGQPSPA
jgi:cell division protease FtsH